MIKTFISHTSSDHPFVEWVKTRLERENLSLDIFVDDGSVFVGDDPQKMIDEVKRSVIFIPVLSNESIQKEFVQNEIMTDIANETTHIFPTKLKCDDASIPEEFRTNFTACDRVEGKIYEDFSDGQEWDIHYENLRRTIFNKIVELGLFKEDTKDYYQDCEHLDLILQRYEPTILEIKTVIDVYLKKEAYQRYFFGKLTSARWLKYLKLYGYLRSNPQPIETVDAPGLFRIPQWDALVYLERVSSQTDKSDEVINDLLDIIISVTSLKDANGQHIDNYRTWYYFTKILLNLPAEKIPEEIISLIPIWLESKFDTSLPGAEIAGKLLPKFLNSDNSEDWRKAESLTEIITDIKWTLISGNQTATQKREESNTIIDPHFLSKAFKVNAPKVGERCSMRVISTLASRLAEIFQKERVADYQDSESADYSFIWFPSLYFAPTVGDRRADITLIAILRDVLLAKAKNNIMQTRDILNKFLSEEYKYPVFKRMVLFIVGKMWDTYKDIFIMMIKGEDGSDYFNSPDYKPELHILLKNNHDKFMETERDLIKKIIGKGPEKILTEDNKEKHIAYWKQKWYFPLKADPEFKALYEEQRKIIDIPEEEMRPESATFRSWSGPGQSPLSKEEIISLSNEELSQRLKEFKTENKWKGPTVGGLAELLAEVAKENPEKFIEEINPFKDTGFIYVYEILKGVKDTWNGKKIFDWAKLFQFIELYINRKEFWEDKFIVEKDDWLGGANHQWIAGIVAELIQDGTRDDSWAFSESHFEKAEKIIFLILDNLIIEEDKEITDYVTYTLNTAFGKAITALIIVALRIARVNDNRGIVSDIKWKPEFKEKYHEILSNKTIEGFTNLGRYMPNFYYLDKEWVKEKIRSLENEKGSKYWDAFMQGYLSIGRVYENLYGLMWSHYEYGLSYDFKERRNREHLIQQICIGYLRGNETLDNPASLFKKIIDEWKAEEIREIIGFFWMQRNYLKATSEEDETIRKKIIEFWKLLYGKYKGKDEVTLNHEDKQILSSASKLTALLPQIDEESYDWLMLSAPYVHEDYNSSFFIEYLDELKDRGEKNETAKYIGDVYLKMLKKITPDFDQEHIRSIVVFLYNTGATDNANRICNIYGSRGHEFLRDLYEKHSGRT